MFEVNGIAYASEKSNKISITDAKVTSPASYWKGS